MRNKDVEKKIIVIDDYFEYPKAIVNESKRFEFKPEPNPKRNWVKERTPNVIEGNEDIFTDIYMTATALFFGIDFAREVYENKRQATFALQYQRISEVDKTEESMIHTDKDATFAAIWYLDENPAIDTGTAFYEDGVRTAYVESKFNRGILFNPSIEHGAVDIIGDRLTLLLFANFE